MVIPKEVVISGCMHVSIPGNNDTGTDVPQKTREKNHNINYSHRYGNTEWIPCGNGSQLCLQNFVHSPVPCKNVI